MVSIIDEILKKVPKEKISSAGYEGANIVYTGAGNFTITITTADGGENYTATIQ